MKKYMMLVTVALLNIMLIATGCQYLPDEFNNLVNANEPPVAYIDSISPTEAMAGETITFVGNGTDTNGSIVAYRWRSNIDGELSVKDNFQTSSLSNGHHTIDFRVQDNNGEWSEEISCTLIVKDDISSLPFIRYFNANPMNTARGNSSKIGWEVLNASSVTIQPDIGEVAPAGTKTVSPNNTTTYTLIAANEKGSINTAIEIIVSSGYAELPTINSFFASPAVIAPGSSSILSWNVSNATRVSISPEIGTVDAFGSATVTPTGTTNYTLVAYNTTGQVNYNISVVLHSLENSISLKELGPEETLTFSATSTESNEDQANSQTNHTFFTVTPTDVTPPVIEKLNVTAMNTSTVIEWTTDEPTDGQVEYGSTVALGNSQKSTKNDAVQHRVTLNGLKPQTTYYFQVRATDIAENETVSDRNSFTTLASITTGVEVGDFAPDFTLDTISGDTVTLSALRGKLIMVTFWTTACGACVAEMPDIQAVYDTWSGEKDLEVLAVNSKQHITYVQRFLDERDWCTIPVPLDTDGAVAREYHITRIPRTFFIDSTGIIRKVQQGRFQDKDEILAILDKLD
jgi:peroxiredoxin